ncbi:SAM-dependent methyltransferase [Actinomadura sp. 3N508]|uniref:SAM-dependent methyltransferase n=1 Tax=Actinomadura sp. 3N508 TaxID=3375153 RepID=UPI0037950AED
MRILVLDGVQVIPDHEPQPSLQPVQRAALFALVCSGHPVSADQLRDLLWPPDSQPKDQKRPVKIMSRLRQMLGGDRIGLGPRGYELCLPRTDIVDLSGWRALVEDAGTLASDDPRTAAEMYIQAMRHWAALPVEAMPDTAPMLELLHRLEGERLGAVERLAEVQRKLGQHPQVAETAQELVNAWPEREHLVEMLMSALHWAGRTVDALAAFDRHNDYVERKIGAVPSTRLRDLREDIRTGRMAPAPPPPPLPPADQAVLDHGGRLDAVTQPRLANYSSEIVFGTYMSQPRAFHTALDRAAVRSILTIAPGVREVQRETLDLTARLVSKLARAGVVQFIELGGLPPSPLAVHDVAHLPRPDARILYLNVDPAMVRYSQHLLAGVRNVECLWGNLETFLQARHRLDLIDFSQPVVVINQHEVNMIANTPEYQDRYAELGELLAAGSYITFTSASTEGLSSGVPWAMQEAYRTSPTMNLIARTAPELASLVPPEFEILPPGATDAWRVWEVWAGQPTPRQNSPGELPTLSLIARKS